jgi:hypothetical protein
LPPPAWLLPAARSGFDLDPRCYVCFARQAVGIGFGNPARRYFVSPCLQCLQARTGGDPSQSGGMLRSVCASKPRHRAGSACRFRNLLLFTRSKTLPRARSRPRQLRKRASSAPPLGTVQAASLRPYRLPVRNLSSSCRKKFRAG